MRLLYDCFFSHLHTNQYSHVLIGRHYNVFTISEINYQFYSISKLRFKEIDVDGFGNKATSTKFKRTDQNVERFISDIDECEVNHGGCSLNANCTNVKGSRLCWCKAGYSGDGIDCTGI